MKILRADKLNKTMFGLQLLRDLLKIFKTQQKTFGFIKKHKEI